MKYNYPFIKIPIDWYICENSDENPTQMCCVRPCYNPPLKNR